MEHPIDIIKDMSLLFELSLNIGSSLDILDNCNSFIKALLHRKDIAFGSIWLKNNIYSNTTPHSHYELYFAYPQFQVNIKTIHTSHSLSKELENNDFCIVSSHNNLSLFNEFITESEIKQGTYVVYKLGEIGFLKLFDLDSNKLSSLKIYQLKKVFEKFTHSLEACIAHQKLLLETRHRKSIQKQLENSEKKYRSVVQNINEGIVITNLQGEAIYLNENTSTMTGYETHELIGRNIYQQIVAPESWSFLQPELVKITQGTSKQFQLLCLNKQNALWWGAFNISPYIGQNGNIIGTLTAITDITEQKINDQKILDHRERLKQILNTSLDCVIIFTKDYSIIDWNLQTIELFEYTPNELSSKKIDQLLHFEEDSTQFIQTELANLNKRLISKAKTKSGHFFPVELSISKIIVNNEISYSLFLRDLTEQKKSENLILRAKKQAEQARNAERQFLTQMSHEIRTPMNAVIGMTELLLDSTPSQKQREYLEALKFSADSLLGLITDILDFSKIEANEIELEMHDFCLHTLLNSLQKTYQLKVKDKKISVDLHIDRKITNQVISDQTKLNQIFNNLLGNASKFTEKGFIGINAILKEDKNDIYWIEFQVYDSGIGIAQENIEKIFQRFKQESKETYRKFGGTGLGLSIVKHLIECYNGKISVSSQLNRGTTFTLLIPFKKSVHLTQRKTTSFNESISLKKFDHIDILIVEDNPINQKLLKAILNKWNCKYSIAKNGNECLQLTKDKTYDLILMDIHMPELDGIETTKLLREDSTNQNQQTPIIALTAAAMQEEKTKMFTVGANGFISKPFSIEQLKKTIEQLT